MLTMKKEANLLSGLKSNQQVPYHMKEDRMI